MVMGSTGKSNREGEWSILEDLKKKKSVYLTSEHLIGAKYFPSVFSFHLHN